MCAVAVMTELNDHREAALPEALQDCRQVCFVQRNRDGRPARVGILALQVAVHIVVLD